MNKIRFAHIIPGPEIAILASHTSSQHTPHSYPRPISGMKGPTSFQASYFDRHLPFTYTQTPNGDYRADGMHLVLIEYKCSRVLELPVLKLPAGPRQPDSTGRQAEQEERAAEAEPLQVRG